MVREYLGFARTRRPMLLCARCGDVATLYLFGGCYCRECALDKCREKYMAMNEEELLDAFGAEECE